MNYEKYLQKQEKIKLNRLRREREKVFKAFDIYKTNVLYGIYPESEADHKKIVGWYVACLELNEEAIHNPPEDIKQYIKE